MKVTVNSKFNLIMEITATIPFKKLLNFSIYGANFALLKE